MVNDIEFQRLKAQVARLEREVEARKVASFGGSTEVTRVDLLTGTSVGQLLVAASSYGSALYGIKRASDLIDTLTTDVDPAGSGAIAQHGVGRGIFMKPDGTTEPVLVINDTRCLFITDLPEGARISVSTVQLTVRATGGPARKAVLFLLP